MIRRIENKDIEEIRAIVYHYWSMEADTDLEFKGFAYSMLTGYYDKNRKYSYLVAEEDKVTAFLFASLLGDWVDKAMLLSGIEHLSLENQRRVEDYYRYLEFNQRHIEKYMTSDSINLGLLASISKEKGKALLQNIEDIAKEEKKRYLLLWADETCNYQYYERLGYERLEEYTSILLGREVKTYIYRLETKLR